MGIYNHKDYGHDIVSKRTKEEERENAAKIQKKEDITLGVRRKGWKTPYGFGDFTDYVTYDEACEHMRVLAQKYFPEDFKHENQD